MSAMYESIPSCVTTAFPCLPCSLPHKHSLSAVKPSVADEARAKTNVTAAQAQQKTDATASVAAGQAGLPSDKSTGPVYVPVLCCF